MLAGAWPVLGAAAAATAALAVARRRRRAGKPQSRFRRVIADTSHARFQHLDPATQASASAAACTSDPAAAAPGSDASSSAEATAAPPEPHARGVSQRAEAERAAFQQQHPHAAAILRLAQELPLPGVAVTGVLPPPLASLEDTPLVMVRGVRQLRMLARRLKAAGRFAVDLEHNSFRSYLGLTSLMQISTGDVDYIVDVLVLHDHMHLLRDVFGDPDVLKVVHGGAGDVMWLQRDYHIYLVNAFDTERAAQVLGRTERSLAHLLRAYCGVTQDKSLQQADWLARPLPPALVAYARGDVHWLLHLADLLVLELQHKEAAAAAASPAGDPPAQHWPLLAQALQKGHLVTQRLYQKPDAAASVAAATTALFRRFCQQQWVEGSTPAAASCVVSTDAASLDCQQLLLIRDAVYALCCWRDERARADDEGPHYVLPDGALLELASQRPSSGADVLRVVRAWVHRLSAAAAAHAHKHSVSDGVKRDAARLVGILGVAAAGQLPMPLPASADPLLGATAPGGAAAAPAGAGAGGGRVKRQQRKAEDAQHRERMIKKFAAKSQVYDNCRMLSSGGALLCYCDERKLRWYVHKGLADIVDEAPLTIQLRFEHRNSQQEEADDAFHKALKTNECVVCGESGHYLRYKIVPACFRKAFPDSLKSHRSHDIVLLCITCHQTAHQAAERLKRRIADEYGVPLLPPRPGAPQPAPAAAAGGSTGGVTTAASGSGDAAAAAAAAAEPAGSGAPCAEAVGESPACGLVSAGEDAASAAGGLVAESAAAQARPASDGGVEEGQAQASPSGPAGGASDGSGAEFVHPFHARAAAIALRRFGEGIPEPRRRQLEGQIKGYLGRRPAEEEPGLRPGDIEAALMAGLGRKKQAKVALKLRLSEAAAAAAAAAAQQAAEAQAAAAVLGMALAPGLQLADPKALEPGAGHLWHGRQVVAQAIARGGEEELLELVRRFRRAFVAACQPQHLPPGWSADVIEHRAYGDYSVYNPGKLPPEQRQPPSPNPKSVNDAPVQPPTQPRGGSADAAGAPAAL